MANGGMCWICHEIFHDPWEILSYHDRKNGPSQLPSYPALAVVLGIFEMGFLGIRS